MRHHCGSIHLNAESMDMIHKAYVDAVQGTYSQRLRFSAEHILMDFHCLDKVIPFYPILPFRSRSIPLKVCPVPSLRNMPN